MKKFISDNMWWIVLLALATGGFALYKIMRPKDDETNKDNGNGNTAN